METKQIFKNLDKARREVKQLEKRQKELTTVIAQLTAKGCQNFQEYWSGKDNKYLYKLFPMKNGERKKVYVGIKQDAIDRAREKKARYELREKKKDDLFWVNSRLIDIQEHLGKITNDYGELFDYEK